MNNAKKILEAFQQCKASKEIEPLVEAFNRLSMDEKLSAESQLINLLKNEDVNQTARAWIPDLMLSVNTPAVRQALMDQLVAEKEGYVRLWIGLSLNEYFKGDDTIALLVQHFDNEPRTINRYEFARVLAESGHPLTLPKLKELLNDSDHQIRIRVAQGLEKAQVKEAAEPLTKRLRVEESAEISKVIVKALVAIRHSGAKSVLLDRLRDENQDQELEIAILQALGVLATGDDKAVIEALLETTCHDNRVVALTATDTLIKLCKTDAASHLAKYGLQQTDPERLSRVADALRLAGGAEAINYLKGIRGDSEQETRAQTLLEQIGGRQAVSILVNQRANTLTQAGTRVKEFDDQALTLFTETIQEAKRGFKISLGMSVTIFAVGVVLLAVSIYLMVQGENLEKILGAGSGLTGLGTILAMFYKGPLERVERSVANLVQTEIAFLGYIRQVTQITAMFEREYMANEEFSIKQLKTLLTYTEHTMKETMPLVSQYTAMTSFQRNGQEVIKQKEQTR